MTNDFIVTHNTTCLAWIAWNFLLTRPYPKIAATSISGDNLADGLWTEMAKWQEKSPLLKKLFEWTKSRIFAREFPEQWWMSARTWPQSAQADRQADTLAGLHADHILFLLDEAGGMPPALLPTAEAALSGGAKEAHIVMAGNPSSLTGALYRACVVARKLWRVIDITGDPDDPNRSSRIPVEYARQQIEQYGRDNPWVLVNIFGRFPPGGINTLVGPEEVQAAMRRVYTEYDIGHAAKVMGVDVARFGDDASCIFKRQGLQAFRPQQYRNLDSITGAGQVIREWDAFGADGVFIDATGGYGAGWQDHLRTLGRSTIGVQFAGQAHNPSRYYNKRAEMYFDAVEWIKRGGALPEDPELLAELAQTTYTIRADRLLLEPTEMVKVRLGRSPDKADALVMTFAEPVSIPSRATAVRSRHKTDWEPFALETVVADSYDPYR